MESNLNSFVKQVTDLFSELGSRASHLWLVDKDLDGSLLADLMLFLNALKAVLAGLKKLLHVSQVVLLSLRGCGLIVGSGALLESHFEGVVHLSDLVFQLNKTQQF
jgi:hypothetical protein